MGLREELVGALNARADELNDQAAACERLYISMAVATLAAAVVLTWLVSRSITKPLRSRPARPSRWPTTACPTPSWASSTRRSARTSPCRKSVRCASTPGTRCPTWPIMLNTVQDTALDLAVEQAVLRRNIADSFVNLGRRNQNLLGRQLDFITELESNETEPDALANLFRLDHLATRNAPQRRVAAGAGRHRAPRQWARPSGSPTSSALPLGEVESYQRVTAEGMEPATILGSAAADLAHLLAELIETPWCSRPPTGRCWCGAAATPRAATRWRSSMPAWAWPHRPGGGEPAAGGRRSSRSPSNTWATTWPATPRPPRHQVRLQATRQRRVTAIIDVPTSLLTSAAATGAPRPPTASGRSPCASAPETPCRRRSYRPPRTAGRRPPSPASPLAALRWCALRPSSARLSAGPAVRPRGRGPRPAAAAAPPDRRPPPPRPARRLAVPPGPVDEDVLSALARPRRRGSPPGQPASTSPQPRPRLRRVLAARTARRAHLLVQGAQLPDLGRVAAHPAPATPRRAPSPDAFDPIPGRAAEMRARSPASARACSVPKTPAAPSRRPHLTGACRGRLHRTQAATPATATVRRRMSRFPFLDWPAPLAFAHQGAHSPDGPGENTMAAFEAAVGLGYRYLETDAHAAADGVLVAFGDRLGALTDRAGVIADLPYAEVKAARVRDRDEIPLLEDLLTAWPDVKVNIDPQARGRRALIELIERTGTVDRVCVGALSDRRLARIRQAPGPRVCTSMGLRRVARLVAAASGLPGGTFSAVRAGAGEEGPPCRW